tara:strand:- start:89 stop:613 length:525 start_codon:yes stop_codon:yes gene_type:complete
MGQEFFINSQELEDKIRQLLPSQGGAGAGFDISASTQIIPIIDLTESASGSNLRQDLQSSLSFGGITSFSVTNATTTVISNTGYFRIFGTYFATTLGGDTSGSIIINDGATDKVIIDYGDDAGNSSNQVTSNSFDFLVFLQAGDILKVKSVTTRSTMKGCTRQIADIDGNLTNP